MGKVEEVKKPAEKVEQKPSELPIEKKAAERPVETYTVRTQLEVVEAEMVDAVETDHFNRVFSGLQMNKATVKPGVIVRARKKF